MVTTKKCLDAKLSCGVVLRLETEVVWHASVGGEVNGEGVPFRRLFSMQELEPLHECPIINNASAPNCKRNTYRAPTLVKTFHRHATYTHPFSPLH